MPVATYDLFGQPASPATLTADPADYTFGLQWSATLTAGQTAVLAGIRFFSAAGAANLPDRIALFAVSGQSLIHSETASWSGAAASGWVTALFATPPALSSGVQYKACVNRGNGGIGNWYSTTGAYWSGTGPGASGITSGPLSAPSSTGTVPLGGQGQDTFTAALALSYPLSEFNPPNYWLDVVVQVTTPAVAGGPPPGGGRSMLARHLAWADL